MSLAGLLIASVGVLLLVVSAIGLFRLPDALARQHAATKSTTLALGLILIGAALVASSGDRPPIAEGAESEPASGWWLRVGLILAFVLLTLPVASHLLGRAAARESYTPEALRDATRVEPDER